VTHPNDAAPVPTTLSLQARPKNVKAAGFFFRRHLALSAPRRRRYSINIL